MPEVKDDKQNKVVVTGGAGFIGSHLCDALVKTHDQVVVFDNLSSGKKDNLPPGVMFVEGDTRSLEAVQAVVAGASTVFHLAAIASVERCENEYAMSHAVNLGGLINIQDALRTHAPTANLVWASSAAVYGTPTDLPLTENSVTNPISSYGLDKLSGEAYGAHAARMYGLKVASMRFFNVVGPRQDPMSPYSGVVSLFIDRMRRGEPVKIFGDGEQTRDFISVHDVVEELLAAQNMLSASTPGTHHVFNVCTGTKTSINELFDMLKTRLSYDQEAIYLPARAGDIRHSLGDPSRNQEMLSQMSFQGIEQMLDILLADPE